ncbi:MAG: cupin [Candidatus Fischerbacteria bacterium RBG_13_37_8]|uniref:Cupin n=1 Tax=Candidatus Fischerbacteria bacterium RBG_13_37_8 TaxID=1817863 RepID=A0A1F5VN55_9BACT|nr:MAG: cupin [Candidatus Fischerbacteria bacterium RBG_13_37_8]
MSIKHMDDVNKDIVKAGTNVSMQVLISSKEGPNFAMRRFIFEPGGEMPRHTNEVEHEQLVLNGKAQVGIGDDVYEVKKGDVLFIPAHVPHWYKNIGEETFEFLCMVPNKQDEIKIIK